MIVKVCGMRDGENIREIAALGVDWIGMVFCDKSPQNVAMTPTHAGIIPDRADIAALHAQLPTLHAPLTVGVFSDEMPQNIITRVVNYQLDLIQLNGQEPPTVIRNLRHTLDPDIRPGIRFIKTIYVNGPEDLAACKVYEDCVDYFLFEMPRKTGEDGWSALEAYNGEKPFLLSGDIGPDDANRILAFHHPKLAGINLNSRFETSPATKSPLLIRTFLDTLQHF